MPRSKRKRPRTRFWPNAAPRRSNGRSTGLPALRFVRLAGLGLALTLIGTPALAEVPVTKAQVVRTLPHDPRAFTQGLLVHEGRLFESTGLYPSTLREVQLETGQVLRQRDLPRIYFGEGIAVVGDRLYSLTWRNQIGFIWSLDDFTPLSGFTYPGEGWGLTSDGQHLIMSDGSSQLDVIDPTTFTLVRSITVTADGQPLDQLNELEWVEGEILANIWRDNRLARINPETGEVTAFIDLTDLVPTNPDRDPSDDVANGVAWDAASRQLYVTGKRWPQLYEIRLD